MKKNGFLAFMKKFCRHRMAMVGLIVLTVEILTVLLLPIVMKMDPNAIGMEFKAAPSWTHLFGTDEIGRDVFARVIDGTKMSLFIGVASTMISATLGMVLGLLAGYYRGIVETIVMRAVDVFQSFPAMVLMLVLAAIFGSSVSTLIIVIGIIGWTTPAKLIYGRVLSVRKQDYIEAAKAIGTSEMSIIFKQVLPNSISPLWMNIAFRVSHAIITESALSFLGAGVKPPQATLGSIIKSAESMLIMTKNPWMWIPAGMVLLLTVVSTNLIGEGVRDALDPKMKR